MLPCKGMQRFEKTLVRMCFLEEGMNWLPFSRLRTAPQGLRWRSK